MPNWCSNSGAIRGSLEELNAIRNFTSFEDIYPRPVYIEIDNIDWNIANWGTKWDVTGEHGEELFETSQLDMRGYIYFNFSTAWSPPLLLFAHLCRRFPSLEVVCCYDEESSEYMGIALFNHREVKDCWFEDYYHKTKRSYEEVIERIGNEHFLRNDLKEMIERKQEDCDEDEVDEEELEDTDIRFQERTHTLLDYMNLMYNTAPVELRPVEFGGVVGGARGLRYVLKIKRFPELPEDWECGICREGKDERSVLKFRCGGDHIFHSICAKEWGKTKAKRREQTTCPMCVRVVSSTASQEPESQQTPIGMDTTE